MQNGGAITADLWTDDFRKRSYIGITVHYMNNDFVLHDRILAIQYMPPDLAHTAANIRQEINYCLRRFYIFDCINELKDRLVFVSDRGTNIVAALKFYERINCIEHILNNIVAAICKVSSVSSIVSSASKLVSHFKTTGLNNRLTETLHATADTRWNTVYYMLASI